MSTEATPANVGSNAGLGAGAEACELTEMERLQGDLDMAEFTREVVAQRLGDMVTTLQGERGVMLGLLRELLAVVETIEPECDTEAFKLWALRAQTARLLMMADLGA